MSGRLLAVLCLLLTAACPSSEPDTVASSLPPELAPVAGTLSVATGLSAADYEFWDLAATTALPVSADGAFAGQVRGRRAGVLFAVPRAATPSAGKLAPGSGLYMSPAPGVQHLTSTRTGAKTTYALSDTGVAAMDSVTTILSLLLLHPMLATPWHAMQQAQARLLVDKVNAGWPAIQAAAQAWDTALAGGQDPGVDAAFKAAIATCVSDVADRLPDPAPLEPPFPSAAPTTGFHHSASRALDSDPTPYALAAAGRHNSVLSVKSASATTLVVEPNNVPGTGLDYFWEAWLMDSTAYPDGLESAGFVAPNNLKELKTARQVGAGFVAARSYASYLDVVNNAVSYISKKLSDAGGFTPTSTLDLSPRQFYEFRFFSGALAGDLGAAAYDHASAVFPGETRAAFQHNIAIAVVEALQVVPGAQALLGDGPQADVLTNVIAQTLSDVDALLRTKPASQITAEDLSGVVYDVLKSAVDALATAAAQGGTEGALKRVASFFAWGAKTAFKEVVGLPGKLSKGGAAANRVLRLVRPDSLIELQIAAVGYLPKVTKSLFVSETIDADALGGKNNKFKVLINGDVLTETPNWSVGALDHFNYNMGDFIEASLTVHTAGGGTASNLDIYFLTPDKYEVTGTLNPTQRFVWTWLGFTSGVANFQEGNIDGPWKQASFSNGRFMGNNVSLFGSDFTANGKTRYEVYTADPDTGLESKETATRMYNLKVIFQ